MSGKIFINYRRGDDPGNTGRLFDRLHAALGAERLFMDVDNIKPGMDFVSVLDEQVEQCDVLLAIIGKGWIGACDASGARRLEDPNDYVRNEIASALAKGKWVIPILLGETRMPRADELPDVLRPLTRRNSVRLTHERFHAETLTLVQSLQEVLHEAEQRRQAQVDDARNLSAQLAERQRAEAEALRKQERVDPVVASEVPVQREVHEVDKTSLRLYPKPAKFRAYQRPLLLISAVCLCGVIIYLLMPTPKGTSVTQSGPPISSGPVASSQAAPAPPSIPGCDVLRTTIENSGTTVALFAADYPKGMDAARSARGILRANGWKMGVDISIPLNASDYSSYIMQAVAQRPTIVVFCGPSSATLTAQGREFGIFR